MTFGWYGIQVFTYSCVPLCSLFYITDEGIGKDGGGRSSVQPLASPEDHMLQASSQPLVSDDVQDGAKPSNVQTPGQFHGPVQVIPVRPGMPPPPPHLGQMPLLPPNFRPMMVPFVSTHAHLL
jgi:hypothetical protein